MKLHWYREYFAEIVVFFVAFGFYSITLCRGVYVGDSGELALATANLQIAHPPGYPLLTNLGHVWTQLLFFLRPIVALNFLSAVAAALSAAVFARWLREPECRGFAHALTVVCAALTLAFSATLWSVATNFEVYSLSAMLTVIALFLLNRFLFAEGSRYLVAALLAFGLGLANHLSILALAPAIAFVCWQQRDQLRWRLYSLLFLALLVPLSLYLYLPIRAQSELILSWYNPATWNGFKQQVFAETYRAYLAAPVTADVMPYLVRLGDQLANELALPFLALSVVGAAFLYRQSKALFLVTILTLVTNVALNFAYTISDIGPYFLPSIIVLCFWLGILLRTMARRWPWSAVCAPVVVVVAVVGNFARSDLSSRTEAEDYAHDLFDRTPINGILFCGSDNSMFPALYLRYVEGYRPDCEVHAHLPSLQRLWRAYGQSNGESWAHFPNLFERALEVDGRRIVMARELMNYDNDFPRLRDHLIAGDLIYATDSTLTTNPPDRRYRVDWKNPPRISDPKLALLYCVYGLVAADQQRAMDDASAKLSYETTAELALAQNDPALLSGLVAHLLDRGEWKLAEKLVHSALRNATLRFEPRLQYWSALGRIHLLSDNVAAAESTYQEILSLKPDHSESHFQLGAIRAVAAARSGAYQKAIGEYEALRALSPENGSVIYQLAMLHLQIGDYVAARTELQECVRLNFRAEDATEMIRQIDERNEDR